MMGDLELEVSELDELATPGFEVKKATANPIAERLDATEQSRRKELHGAIADKVVA